MPIPKNITDYSEVYQMIIGRNKEITLLNNLYDSGSAELVALYGRRRVGKTFLVDELFNDRITFRHAGLSPIDIRSTDESGRKSRMKDQLKHFYRSLTEQGMEKHGCPSSWLDAFYMLEDLLSEKDDGKGRLLIFIDEIQWLDTPRAGFMTGLEAFWNGWACHRRNIMLIVCGSSTSWILDKVINNHGGLYDRVTRQINLKPFSLYECEKMFEDSGVEMSRYDMVQSYMMVGGIPYYMKYFSRELSFPQNIDAIFFDEGAPLRDEFNRLFSSLFVNPEVMLSIVTALSKKNRGLTRKELLNQTGLSDSGEFSNQLKALISGDFIIKYSSLGNGREPFYKLTDPFCIFWLKFVKNSKPGRTDWTGISESPSVTSWRGLAFENVCFNHIDAIKEALGIRGVSTEESMWSKIGDDDEAGTQIDLIIKRRDNVVNMCEAKFYSDEFAVNKDYHFKLIRRKNMLNELIPKKAVVHNTLITTYGLKPGEYASDFIHVVTMDDLFKG